MSGGFSRSRLSKPGPATKELTRKLLFPVIGSAAEDEFDCSGWISIVRFPSQPFRICEGVTRFCLTLTSCGWLQGMCLCAPGKVYQMSTRLVLLAVCVICMTLAARCHAEIFESLDLMVAIGWFVSTALTPHLGSLHDEGPQSRSPMRAILRLVIRP